MAENPHSNAVAAPEPVSTAEVEAQLAESQRVKEEASATADRADATANEMARALRRIMRAIERNPQSWDELFDGRTR